MKSLKLIFILIFSICLLSCAFEENREVEKKLAVSINNFHDLFNEEKFEHIYLKADEELKNKFTEQQFVSYLKAIKNDIGKINIQPHIWIEDELKDGIKRILFRRTRFSSFELVSTDTAVYRERIDWKLTADESNLIAFQIEKICNKPCQLNFETK